MSKLDGLTASFERLSSRDQTVALVLGAVVFTLVVGLGGFVVNKKLRVKERGIQANISKLEELYGLRGNYQKRLASQKKLSRTISKNQNLSLLSYLEDISKKTNITLKNAQERNRKRQAGNLRIETAEVTIENVSMDRLFDFLKRIEQGNKLVKVGKLSIETRFDNKLRLNAKVTVDTFKIAEAG